MTNLGVRAGEAQYDRIPGLAKAFGAVLRRHRHALGLTQEELAVEVEMDRTFLSLMERGLRRPSLATVFVLARRFGLTASEAVKR
ncbi:MAG TPA: helix-turn-helix transcriptional regulator [Candidatus Kapabacteria bacterium]|nr:helix-turn-helix transcriptional regulator [Candidatus Kapabacteria bacterium]